MYSKKSEGGKGWEENGKGKGKVCATWGSIRGTSCQVLLPKETKKVVTKQNRGSKCTRLRRCTNRNKYDFYLFIYLFIITLGPCWDRNVIERELKK